MKRQVNKLALTEEKGLIIGVLEDLRSKKENSKFFICIKKCKRVIRTDKG